jgi:hypothetical protein
LKVEEDGITVDLEQIEKQDETMLNDLESEYNC